MQVGIFSIIEPYAGPWLAALQQFGEASLEARLNDRQNSSVVIDALATTIGNRAGQFLSREVNEAGVKLLQSMGQQFDVLSNILLIDATSASESASEIAFRELSRKIADENYQVDWSAISEEAKNDFIFNLIPSVFEFGRISKENKDKISELSKQAKELCEKENRISHNKGQKASAEEKYAATNRAIQSVENLWDAINDNHLLGAIKQGEQVYELIWTLEQKMLVHREKVKRWIRT